MRSTAVRILSTEDAGACIARDLDYTLLTSSPERSPGRRSIIHLHARPLLIRGRDNRLVSESLPGLFHTGRACSGVYLCRGRPAESEHPPGTRPAVVPLAEAEVNDGINLGVQIPAAD